MFKSPKYNQIQQSYFYAIICDTAAQEIDKRRRFTTQKVG
jgi:hypothetical protein